MRVLHRHSAAAERRLEERVGCIVQLYDAATSRRPLGLRIVPHELPIEYSVIGCCFDDLSDECISTFDDFEGFFGGCGLRPAFYGGAVFVLIFVNTSGYRRVGSMACKSEASRCRLRFC